MIGFVKRSTIIAILLLSATFAYAGNDLKAVHESGTNMHPDGKSNALTHVPVANETARAAIGEAIVREEARDARVLRPVKDDKLRAVK
jgi:hypothetical protein